MAWWGKLLGGTFGFMLGGPLGALLGASLGHSFDQGLSGQQQHAGQQERVQTAFFTATFAVMGHIAKADGRVSRDEIVLAQQVMHHMKLDDAQRQLARKLFDQGKQDGFQLDAVLLQFRAECHGRSNLIRMFMEIQIQAALADGKIVPEENQILQRVADAIGIARGDLERLIEMIRGATHGATGAGDHLELRDAYRILGVKADTPLPEIRKAYRRLRGQHHPDKLVSKGLPEEMMQLANDKTHEIRSAWECVKQARQRS